MTVVKEENESSRVNFFELKPHTRRFNAYGEFSEFSVCEIKNCAAIFKRMDTDMDGFLNLEELKMMMQEIGMPQTHITLKQIIKEVDDENACCQDGQVSFKKFFRIFQKCLQEEAEHSKQNTDSNTSSEMDDMASTDSTSIMGVSKAKNYFESKIKDISKANQLEDEIKEMQERKKQEALKRLENKKKFKAKTALFESK